MDKNKIDTAINVFFEYSADFIRAYGKAAYDMDFDSFVDAVNVVTEKLKQVYGDDQDLLKLYIIGFFEKAYCTHKGYYDFRLMIPAFEVINTLISFAAFSQILLSDFDIADFSFSEEDKDSLSNDRELIKELNKLFENS